MPRHLYSVERTETDGPTEPFAQEGHKGDQKRVRESYKEELAQSSGTEQDVSVLNDAPTSLGKMMKSPKSTEKDYKQSVEDNVAEGRPQFKEDKDVADSEVNR